jgi:hypothetical protein
MQAVFSILLVAFMIFALVDVITRDSSRIRYLGKLGWVIVIVLLPLIGSALYFVIGRERDERAETLSFGDPARAEARRYDPSRTSRASAEFTADDERAIEEEIAFHEKQAEIRRLEADIKAKREGRSEANG